MNFTKIFSSLIFLGLVSNATLSKPSYTQSISGKIKISVDPRQLTTGDLPADILFVVDDSGSMQTHQNRLAESSTQLINLITQSTNAHIGVLTTSTENMGNGIKPGEIVAPFLKSSDPAFAEKFKKMIIVGNNGDGEEKPFESLSKFIATKDSGNNRGFLRDGANLSIVIISDASDSSLVSPFEIAYKLYETKKGRLVKVFGILVPSSEGVNSLCGRDQSNVFPDNIEALVAMFRGVVVPLCSEQKEFSSGLEKIGQDIFKSAIKVKVPVSVPLKYRPLQQSIQVSYSTYKLPNDSNAGWMYDSINNRIFFPIDYSWGSEADGSLLTITFDLDSENQ